jgi:hypothetical protein
MNEPEVPYPSTPTLAAFFWVLGFAEILAGITIGIALWPGAPKEGYIWQMVAYVPVITWLITGLISGVISWALAQILTYLSGIYANTLSRSV